MKLTIIESPFAGDIDQVTLNIIYARACVHDSLMRDEAPIASHLLYTQDGILDDKIPTERKRGIDAGLAWLKVAEQVAVYTDLGVSNGMKYGINVATSHGVPIVYRQIIGYPLGENPDE